MFLQTSHILSTFSNIYHAPTELKESPCIRHPACTSTEDNDTSHTQIVEPALGFTPAEICHAQNEPKLTVPQLLEIESCKDYVKTPLQTLDGIYVTQRPQTSAICNMIYQFVQKHELKNHLTNCNCAVCRS